MALQRATLPMSTPPAALAPIYPLYQTLVSKVIPWAEQWGTPRITVARHDYKDIRQEPLPRGVQAVQRELSNCRPVSRKLSMFNYTIPTRQYPQDGMEITDWPVIACVVSGAAQLEAGNYYLQCEEGNFLFYPPQVARADGMKPHLRDREKNQGATDIFWLYHWKDGIICHTCHSRGQEHQATTPHEHVYLRSRQALLCFEVIIEEMAKPSGGDLRVFRSLLLSMLLVLRTELEQGNYIQPGAAVTDEAMTEAENPILQAAHYVSFHLENNLTIDRMAQKYFMSRSQFTKRFRATMGISFGDYLTEQRLSAVSALLRDTDWALEPICQMTGIKQSNLRSHLRNRMGLSPVEYRRYLRSARIEAEKGEARQDVTQKKKAAR